MKKTATAALILVTLGLGGCLETVIPKGEPGPYDGRWVGRINLSYGERSCLRRNPLQGTIEGGYLTALTRHKDAEIKITGFVTTDGVLERGDVYTGRFDRDTGITGEFSESEARGRWKTDKCQGEWTLRRVSRSVQ